MDVNRGHWRDETNGKVLFRDFAEEYLRVKGAELAPGTVRNYRTLLNTMLLPSFGAKPLNAITKRHVQLWWAAKDERPVNRRNAFFCLRSIMNLAVEWDYIAASPVVVKNAGKDVAKRRPDHTVEEFHAVVNELPEWLVVPAWTLLGSHARVSELAGLNRGDFNAQTGTLHIERQDSEIGGRHLKGTKTGQVRTLTVLSPADDMLRDHVNAHLSFPTVPLFMGPRGARLSARLFRIHWDKACEAAGVEDFHVHDIRHVGLTHVAQHGATNADIKLRGGHASDSAAARYQHATAARDAEIARRSARNYVAS